MIANLKGLHARLFSDQSFSEILTGTAWAMVARVAATGLAMVSSIIVARVYGAEAVGVLAVVNSFLVLVTIFTVLGTDISVLRLIPEHMAKYSVTSAFLVHRKTQWFVVGVSVVTGGVFFLGSGVIAARVFSKPHLSHLLALAAAFVVFNSLMVLNTSAVRGLRLIKTFAFMQVIPSLVMLVVLLVFTFLARHPDSPVHAQLAAYAVTALVGVWIMHRSFKARMYPGEQVNSMPLGAIVALSTPMLMTASMHFFIGQTGVVMLGMFRTEAEVGYYALAARLAALTTFVLQAINSMAAPTFSELYHTGKLEQLLHVARKSSKLIFWITAPILATLLVFGKPILGLLFGDEFTVAYPALVFLVLGQFVNSISGSTGFFMNMTGNQGAFRNIVTIAAGLTVLLGVLLIPRFGIEGAAIAGGISLVSWNLATLIFIRRRFGRSIGYLPGRS